MSVDAVAEVLARMMTDNSFHAQLRKNGEVVLANYELSAEELRFFTEPKRLTGDEVDLIRSTGFSFATYGSAFGYVNRNISSLSQDARKELNNALTKQDFNFLGAVPCTGWD